MTRNSGITGAPATTGYRPSPASFWRRIQEQAFNGWLNSAISLVFLTAIVWLGYGFIDWAVFRAVFVGESTDCRALEGSGACWALIQHWGIYIIFGQFPREEIWRPELALAIFIAAMALSLWRRLWWWRLAVLWAVTLVVYLWRLMGGRGLE
ncbi:MAG: hypothetical protein ORO03_08120, partial [Alphaproteobacteria bacterium]|nr:hypothetical protein [Alphaproteobacteria bacterium]